MINKNLVLGGLCMSVHQEPGKLPTAVNPHGVTLKAALVNLELDHAGRFIVFRIDNGFLNTLVGVAVVDQTGEKFVYNSGRETAVVTLISFLFEPLNASFDVVLSTVPVSLPDFGLFEVEFALSMIDSLFPLGIYTVYRHFCHSAISRIVLDVDPQKHGWTVLVDQRFMDSHVLDVYCIALEIRPILLKDIRAQSQSKIAVQ